MEKFLEVERRESTGKGAMRRLRNDGMVPAVVYSAGADSLPLMLSNQDLLMGVRGCRPTQIFTFKSKDKELDGVLAFIKDVQTEPIKDRVLHVDFLSVEAGRAVIIEVPVELVGEPAEVKAGLAVLEQRAYGLRVECDPKRIPAMIEVDVSKLAPGESIFASSIELPEGVEMRSGTNTAVASLTATRAASMAASKDK